MGGMNHQEVEAGTTGVARRLQGTKASQRAVTVIDGPPHLQQCHNPGRMFHMGLPKWSDHTHRIGPRQTVDHTTRTGQGRSCRLFQENVGGVQITTDPSTMSGVNVYFGKNSLHNVTPS